MIWPRENFREVSHAASMWCGLIPAGPYFLQEVSSSQTRQKRLKEEVLRSRLWPSPQVPGIVLDDCTHVKPFDPRDNSAICISFTSPSYWWEDWILKGKVVCSKVHSPKWQDGFPISLSLEPVIFPPVPTSLPKGRISHHIPVYNCFKEAAKKKKKKKILYGWLFLVLGNENLEVIEDIYLLIQSYEISWVAAFFFFFSPQDKLLKLPWLSFLLASSIIFHHVPPNFLSV